MYLYMFILSFMQFLGYESTSDLSNKIDNYLKEEIKKHVLTHTTANKNDEENIVNKVIEKSSVMTKTNLSLPEDPSCSD